MDPPLKRGGSYVLTCSGEAFVLRILGIDIFFYVRIIALRPQQGATKVV
jgi:hypothetical protein